MRKKVSSAIALVAILFLPIIAHSQDSITYELLLGLTSSDAKFVNSRDIEGLMSLFADDYSNKQLSGEVTDKASIRLKASNIFMNFLAVLRKVEIKSYQIAQDGKSADLVLVESTKVLSERNGEKIVFPEVVESKMKVILIDGAIKYSKREAIQRL